MSLSLVLAGFIAVLVGYTGSAAIVFQAALAAGATDAQLGSWMGVLGLGMGLTCIGLSLRYRAPIITAWSTPGAAILAVSLTGLDMSAAVGAFLFSGLLITLLGVSGLFARVIDRIPLPLAAAMLAGVLARFGMDVFVAMQDAFALVATMFMVYLLTRRWFSRFAIIIVFFTGIGLSAVLGLFDFSEVELSIARPVWVTPTFEWQTLLGVGVPLFLVTMASQNVPGVAVLRSFGYARVPISPLISVTGLTTLLLAPFGGYAFNLAAITAAICAGPGAHPDPDRRYIAGVSAGVFYLVAGLFGATVAGLFVAFPEALVLAVAGIALLGTIAASLKQAISPPEWREPALITFLVTLSGVTLFGIGSAFWGLVAGVTAMLILGRGEE